MRVVYIANEKPVKKQRPTIHQMALGFIADFSTRERLKAEKEYASELSEIEKRQPGFIQSLRTRQFIYKNTK